ncbi:hypothetical protein NDU88_004640 [Pleurodeles waltl]|uniref:Uncharacterized protein n=1 Tax=Pleurodeles waltl TaxID=8319 RepID=A0AAV7QF56_PLEWA|nr:hypothetical protein NDU88_004640 [Pleurodeles waltl]
MKTFPGYGEQRSQCPDSAQIRPSHDIINNSLGDLVTFALTRTQNDILFARDISDDQCRRRHYRCYSWCSNYNKTMARKAWDVKC